MSVIFRSIKKAMALIHHRGSLLRMILAGIMLCFAWIIPMMIGVYTASTIFEYSEVPSIGEYVFVYAMTAALGVIVTIPTSAMFYTYTWSVYSNSRYGYVDRERKRGYNYFRNLFSGFLLLARPVVCVIIMQTAYALTVFAERALKIDQYGVPMIILLVPFMGIALAVSAVFLWFTNFAFMAPYYYGRGMSAPKALRLSIRCSKKHPFWSDGFSIVFIALSLLSLLSFGVFFILGVLPILMFTYFTLAEHMDGSKLLEE